jgi:hypothetical protein
MYPIFIFSKCVGKDKALLVFFRVDFRIGKKNKCALCAAGVSMKHNGLAMRSAGLRSSFLSIYYQSS